jgi:ABC-type branched-subunit amino acid transport system ATPase component
MIEMHSVVAGYGGGDVLQGVDLVVPAGAITCIVGPNGAGKSTVLRAISGLVAPRQGHITFAGERISGWTPAKVIAGGIVQVPQQGGLFADLTIRDNMLLGGYLIRRDRARLRRRIAELEDVFPIIRERAGEKAANLSGGQRRIVEFARALVLKPRMVLLDEPTLGLDPKSSELVFENTRMMQQLGTTVLMVEQNVRFGLKLASHGVVMERGKVLLADTAEALLKRPDMAALFFGSGAGPETAEPQPRREDDSEGAGA